MSQSQALRSPSTQHRTWVEWVNTGVCTWPRRRGEEAAGPPGGRSCESGGLPLTQDPVGWHDGDSDGLRSLPGLDGEGDSRGDSLDQPQVLELEAPEVLAVPELFT